MITVVVNGVVNAHNKNYKLKRDSKKYTDSQLLGAPYTEVVEVVCMNEIPWESDNWSDSWANESERDEEESIHTFMWFGLLI